MVNPVTPYSSSSLDHLGLVAGMVDELGLTDLIDTVVPQDHEQRHVSVGVAVKAMILNGLGLINRALYLTPHFFKDKPVERLLSEGIDAESLNDDTLGRALEDVYAYGPEKLYGQLAAQAVKRLGLSCAVGHLDATSVHVDGTYNSGQDAAPEGVIHVTQGYSRDHRPDLNQVVLQLITEHQADIPLWMEALSGNRSGKDSFRQTLPNQRGEPTAKPTARWIFQFFAGIHVLLVEDGKAFVLNLNAHHSRLLGLLGERYVQLYAGSG